MGIAQKTNPRLWQEAKRKACSSGKLCKHSARKMQWATRYYKSRGGGYVGAKRADNSLHRWGKQKWRTSSGRKSGGRLRYLPDRAWNHLSKSEIAATNRSKLAGYRKGRQYVAQPSDVARKTRRYRTAARSGKRRRSSKGRRRSSKGRRRSSKGRRRSSKS